MSGCRGGASETLTGCWEGEVKCDRVCMGVKSCGGGGKVHPDWVCGSGNT